jgi:acyl-coenzyme A synthetase/AMP-(fatty) acid ligase
MIAIDFLLQRFAENPNREAVVWRDKVFDYRWLLDRVEYWQYEFVSRRIAPQSIVILEGDYSPNSIALFLALLNSGSMVVPLTELSRNRKDEFCRIAQGEIAIRISGDDHVSFHNLDQKGVHPLYGRLRQDEHPGLVLFSSGSTGAAKAAVHDFVHLAEKYRTRRHNLRTLAFMLYDHIGGVDTLLYCLSNLSCIITLPDRLPDTVCAAVQNFAVEVLPVSPSFLNLLILGQSYKRYDLSTLKHITYGAEVMPETTLRKCHEILPAVNLLQKFGTTEVGTLRSRSKSSDSTWVEIGGDGFDVRVVDGILQIKSLSAILGYLNAPSPFTEDGWFSTGDLVEVDGEYMRILGRESDIINVGGEKVNPAEVESVIQAVDNVAEATVYGEANPITGHIVCARVSMIEGADQAEFVKTVKRHCRDRLERFKVPVKVQVTAEKQHTERFKKRRVKA